MKRSRAFTIQLVWTSRILRMGRNSRSQAGFGPGNNSWNLGTWNLGTCTVVYQFDRVSLEGVSYLNTLFTATTSRSAKLRVAPNCRVMPMKDEAGFPEAVFHDNIAIDKFLQT